MSFLKNIMTKYRTSKELRGLRTRLFQMSYYPQLGLRTDDILDEMNPATSTAVLRLPEDVKQQRDFRLMRAVQLSSTKRVLPKEEWITLEDNERYLTPYIRQAQAEIDEQMAYDTLNLSYKIKHT